VAVTNCNVAGLHIGVDRSTAVMDTAEQEDDIPQQSNYPTSTISKAGRFDFVDSYKLGFFYLGVVFMAD
jgi:hypothetical protein